MSSDGSARQPFAGDPRDRLVPVPDDEAHSASPRATGGDVDPHSLQLWNAVVSMRDWDVMADVGGYGGDLSGESDICLRIDARGVEHGVIEGVADVLPVHDHWAAVIEIAHLSDDEVVDLVRRYRAAMLDHRCGQLIGVPPATNEALRNWISAPWLYRRELVLMSDDVARERTGGLDG